jgi:hypothetical protein
MLSNFVGQERFLLGVSIYLKDHLYGNTVTKDLWDGIGRATCGSGEVGIDIPKMMDNWIMKVYSDDLLPALIATHISVWPSIDGISSAYRDRNERQHHSSSRSFPRNWSCGSQG